MNYSRSTKRRKDYAKRIIISWIVFFLLGLFVGSIIGLFTGKAMASYNEPKESEEASTYFFTQEVQEPESYVLQITEEIEPTSEEETKELLGLYRITAYCSCEKCCGEWAKNRPDGIVKGAMGVELTPGISAASTLPFGTKLYIEGYGEVVVQDRMANWVVEKYDGKVVDVYFNDHEEACNFGLMYCNVYQIIESED